MLVLFLSLMIIYVILFNIKWDILKDKITPNTQQYPPTNAITTINNPNTQEETTISNTTDDIRSMLVDNTDNRPIQKSETTQTINTNSGWFVTHTTWTTFVEPGNQFEEQTNPTNNDIDNQDDIFILSGTKKYYGPLIAIEKLGITYQYALKDDKDIYYIAYKASEQDLIQIVRQLWGSIYTLSSEQDMVQNNLFGDKISFINIPELKDKVVIMIIEANNTKRMVQISHAIYHQSKNYLKKIILDQ